MRTESFVGLNNNALNFLDENCKTKNVKKYEDGELVSDKNVVKVIDGKYEYFKIFSDDIKVLPGYLLKDGKFAYEKVQREVWSSGPVTFTKLVDENDEDIEESIWSESSMNEHL